MTPSCHFPMHFALLIFAYLASPETGLLSKQALCPAQQCHRELFSAVPFSTLQHPAQNDFSKVFPKPALIPASLSLCLSYLLLPTAFIKCFVSDFALLALHSPGAQTFRTLQQLNIPNSSEVMRILMLTFDNTQELEGPLCPLQLQPTDTTGKN